MFKGGIFVRIYLHCMGYFNMFINEPKTKNTNKNLTFENVIKKNGGEIFGLPNDDMVVFYHQNSGEEIQACLVKIRFMFHDDPLLQNAF